MSKRDWKLLLLAVALGGAYVYFFTDFLRPPRIEIFAQIRAMGAPMRRGGAGPAADICPVTFNIGQKYELISVKVVEEQDYERSKGSAKALWHLIADTNSLPTKGFLYGALIPGMKPATPRAKAEVLQTNITYRLFIESVGGLKGTTTFVTKPIVRPPPPPDPAATAPVRLP